MQAPKKRGLLRFGGPPAAGSGPCRPLWAASLPKSRAKGMSWAYSGEGWPLVGRQDVLDSLEDISVDDRVVDARALGSLEREDPGVEASCSSGAALIWGLSTSGGGAAHRAVPWDVVFERFAQGISLCLA